MFYLITQYLPQCYTHCQLEDITYNFSEAGHGKSSADGIGGYLKKFVDDQVKYDTDVSDFDSLRCRFCIVVLNLFTLIALQKKKYWKLLQYYQTILSHS